jgi:hypothetical protein
MVKFHFTGAEGFIFAVLWRTVLGPKSENVSSVKRLDLFSNSIQWFSRESALRRYTPECSTELVSNLNGRKQDLDFTDVKAGVLVSDREKFKTCSLSCIFIIPSTRDSKESDGTALLPSPTAKSV